jgi:hypothetical protein
MTSREAMERSLKARMKMVKHQIRALPTAEKLRAAADLLDKNMPPDMALNIVKQLALPELEEMAKKKEPAGG